MNASQLFKLWVTAMQQVNGTIDGNTLIDAWAQLGRSIKVAIVNECINEDDPKEMHDQLLAIMSERFINGELKHED